MHEDLPAQRTHPSPALFRGLIQGRLDRVLDALEVMRVGEVCLAEFGCGAGEFAEHQCAAEVAATGHVLLGDQIHAVAQRGDQHDVGRDEERDQLVAGYRPVNVVHDRMADFAVLAVDVADLALDVFAHLDVALDALPAWRRELHQNGVVAFDPMLGEQLRKRPQPNVDALGVVQPVDAEQDLARIAELAADLAGPLPDGASAGLLVERRRVDGDREGADLDRAEADVDFAEPGTHTDRPPRGVRTDETAGQDHEVLRAAGQVEPDQIGAEQALGDLGPPRHLHEQLHRRERDVQKEADGQIGPQHPQHLRDQLQLIVLYPHRRALGRHLRGRLGEAPVDRRRRRPTTRGGRSA